ncbi:MAG TPA: Tm-1-like ATP-binding domain-containing protein [Patescibacteria group bacterium]|nr:Tm-1-like ATP-binding domain-containing protein [Patescibacteria group bacterium]
MSTVVLVGTLDTKGAEIGFVRERLEELGAGVLVIDAGVLDQSLWPADIDADAVAAAGGAKRADLAADRDRSAAMAAMRAGVLAVVTDLYRQGRLDGILALGGSGGASLAAGAMQALPVGVPKLIVSTMAAGDTRPYVGESDIAMLYPVVDIAGLNRLSRQVLGNAAAAMAGMVAANAGRGEAARAAGEERPLIGATMFGVTTPCVTAARERLEAMGYEVLVFHATGTGGRAMEGLVRSGFIGGVLDVTTTELADELVGGVLSAGPDRLTAAGSLGIPQVVSLGALDMVNFGPRDTVPAEFRDRRLYEHNASVTLLRTSVEECRELGRILAGKLNAATGPTSLFIPRGGVSMIDVPGAAFHDPAADAALFDALLAHLDPRIEVVDLPVGINDPSFGPAMADRLDALLRAGQPVTSPAG